MGEITNLQLEIERMNEVELSGLHMKYIRKCMEHDLWKDISDTYEYMMREALGKEIRIRMSAQ